MRDFDITRHERPGQDRTFKIGGQHFEYGPAPAADLLAVYFDAITVVDTLAAADALVERWLTPETAPNWKVVRAIDREYPLTILDVQDVINEMLAVCAGRPTGRPSGSGDSSLSNGTPSTASLPSPVVA